MTYKPKQDWTIGSVVKVGFLQLRVIGHIPTPSNYRPDEYALESLDVNAPKYYTFTPHHGLFRVPTRAAAFVANY